MKKTISELGFKSSTERISGEVNLRYESAKNPLKLGIKFLDDMFFGITKHDLVLVGAKTGIGKTELVTTIALESARRNKRVYVFALEAEPSEIERRIRFKILAKSYSELYPGRFITYRDFIWGHYPKEFQELDTDFNDVKKEALDNLFTFYRTGDFGIKDFTKLFAVIEKEADLIIVDHIHFFDMETDNENKELADITKSIRDLALISGVPVILVGHLRKSSGSYKKAIPDIDDFHGSSNLAKQVTKAVILENGGPTADGKFVTLIRVVKDRIFGGSTRYAGKVIFDPRTNSYEPEYTLCTIPDGDALVELKKEQWPAWLKNS